MFSLPSAHQPMMFVLYPLDGLLYQYKGEYSESITFYISDLCIWYSLKEMPALCFLNLPGECRYEKVRCLRRAKTFPPSAVIILSNIPKTSCIISVVIQSPVFAK